MMRFKWKPCQDSFREWVCWISKHNPDIPPEVYEDEVILTVAGYQIAADVWRYEWDFPYYVGDEVFYRRRKGYRTFNQAAWAAEQAYRAKITSR